MGTEYFKHVVYSPFFFSSKFSLFRNSNLFGSCIIHILFTECAKIKKNNSGAKRLHWDGHRFSGKEMMRTELHFGIFQNVWVIFCEFSCFVRFWSLQSCSAFEVPLLKVTVTWQTAWVHYWPLRYHYWPLLTFSMRLRNFQWHNWSF